MPHQIFAAEINFQDTPLLVREKFVDSEKNIKRLLLAFRKRVEEVFIFANRQRFTVYVVHDDLSPLTAFFHDEHHLKGYVQYYYNTGEAVTHLMATASGLLSVVKGESRVMAEVSRCYEWATDCAVVGVTLDHAIRRSLDTGKVVRTETGIDKFCSSVVDAGIELLYGKLQNIHEMNFLVVGTGQLATVALDALLLEGISNIAVTGHDAGEVTRLAGRYGIRAVYLPELPETLADADVVIGVAHQALERSELPAVTDSGLRDKSSRVILDLGVPPNFDPDTVGMFADEFYSLDDLRRLHPSPLECFGGVEAAWRAVLSASNEFALLWQLLQQSPVLSAYLTRQFASKKPDTKVKPKISIRAMLAFRKNDRMSAIAEKAAADMRTQLNNHLADNALDVVRNVKKVRRFHYLMWDN